MADQRKTCPEGAGARSNGEQTTKLESLKRLLFRSQGRQQFEVTEDHIHSLLLARRARGELLGEELFSDPAWEVMLELYAAKLGNRESSLSELALATGTPPSTLERWIAALKARGLTTSTIDSSNSTRVVVSLTAEAVSKLEHLAKRWGAALASI